MDAIFGIIVVVAIIIGLNVALRAGVGAVKAGASTLTGKGTFKENFGTEFAGMGAIEARLRETRVGEHDHGLLALAVEVRGLMPIDQRTAIGFQTSILDTTDGYSAPVISALEQFQEQDTTAYQHRVDAGVVEPNQGYAHWTQVGLIVPDMLEPPYSGRRQMSVLVRVINSSAPPVVTLGLVAANKLGCLVSLRTNFVHEFTQKGYMEAIADRTEAQKISVRMAVSVAMADGSLDDSEGLVIKNWIHKHVSTRSGDDRESLKNELNSSFKHAYEAATTGTLSLSEVTQEMDAVADNTQRYDAIELCYDVMAADGVADQEEINTIRRMADALSIDYDELQQIHDRKVVELNVWVGSNSPEELLGIDPSWDRDTIDSYLRAAYKKWNARLNTLNEGTERENAQRMLNAISKARKKYKSNA